MNVTPKHTTIFGLSLAIVFFGSVVASAHWDKVEKEQNAFAKDCNDRGGVATFSTTAHQCIGAKVSPPAKRSEQV